MQLTARQHASQVVLFFQLEWWSRAAAEGRRSVLHASAGRVVPELGDETLREWFAYSYRIIYRIEKDLVIIAAAAVVHGKRLLDVE